MSVIRFQVNVPVECALKYDPPGIEVMGKYGPQIRFTTADDRLLYLPPLTAQHIAEMKIVRGERFTIAKTEVKHEGQKRIEWQVKRLEPQPALDPRPVQEIIAGGKLVPINGGSPKFDEETAGVLARGTLAASCLKTAIAACAEAEKFAKEINYGLRFEPQQVYGLACTLLIGKQRENGGANGAYR